MKNYFKKTGYQPVDKLDTSNPTGNKSLKEVRKEKLKKISVI